MLARTGKLFMCLFRSVSRSIGFVCLTLFLTTFRVSQADAKAWGKGGKKRYTNAAPTIRGLPAGSVTVGNKYEFKPNASDADGDGLTFTINNRPSWASFSSSTGRLSGAPHNNHAGTYENIKVTVSDGSSSASMGPFSITVLEMTAIEVNGAPEIYGSPATSVEVGSFYDFQPVSGDRDGDSLTFSIQNRPTWARFDTSTGRLVGSPTAGDVGSYNDIRLSVSDGTVATTLPAFSLTVTGGFSHH